MGTGGRQLNEVMRARDGDRDAFESLVHRHTAWSFRLAAAIVGPDQAADVTQEAFLRVWRELPRLRDAERFEPWLRRIVVNACRDMARRSASRVREVQLVGAIDDAPGMMSADPRSSVEGDADVARALAGLPLEQRTVLALHYAADLPLAAVADVLGIPAGTAKSRLNAALVRLRSGLEDHR